MKNKNEDLKLISQLIIYYSYFRNEITSIKLFLSFPKFSINLNNSNNVEIPFF